MSTEHMTDDEKRRLLSALNELERYHDMDSVDAMSLILGLACRLFAQQCADANAGSGTISVENCGVRAVLSFGEVTR